MKKWEVYRVIPESWGDIGLGRETTYCLRRTRRAAQRVAERCDYAARNGRSDEDFAVFKVRKIRKEKK
jgi:hypothetical protein